MVIFFFGFFYAVRETALRAWQRERLRIACGRNSFIYIYMFYLVVEIVLLFLFDKHCLIKK